MKISKLFQALLFASFFLFRMGIVEDTGVGADGKEDDKDDTDDQSKDDKSNDDDKGGDDGKNGDAKSKMSDAEAKLLKENMQKKEALAEANKKLAEATERLKAFEGLDPAEIRKLVDAQKAAETAQLEAKGEYERVKQRMAEEHSNALQGKDAVIQQLQQQLATKDSTINELTVGQQFAASQFIAKELTLTPSKARVVYGDHFDIVEGKLVAFDKPRGAANRTALVDQYGNNVGFDDALRKIVEADPDKDHLFRSKVKTGANSDSKSKGSDLKIDSSAEKDSISKINDGLKGLKISDAAGLVM